MLTLRPLIRGRGSRPPSRPGTTHEIASITSSTYSGHAESLYIESDQNIDASFFTRAPNFSRNHNRRWAVREHPAMPALLINTHVQDDKKSERSYVEAARQNASAIYTKIPCYTIARIDRTGADSDLPPPPDSPVAFAEPTDNIEGCWRADFESDKWSTTGQTWAEEMEERDGFVDDECSEIKIPIKWSRWKSFIKECKRRFHQAGLLGKLLRRRRSRVKAGIDSDEHVYDWQRIHS